MSPLALRAVLLLAAIAADRPEGVDPYPAGERLEYRVKVSPRILPVSARGTATMSVTAREGAGGREAARLKLRLRSKGLAAKLYHMDNNWTSTVDVATGETLAYRFEKNERNRRELQEFTVDPVRRLARSSRRRGSGKEQRWEVRLDGPVQDVLSVFYHLRRLPLELGKFSRLTVFEKDKAYPMRLAADGLEQVKVPGAGVFWAIVVHPSAGMPGLFSDKGSATIWLEETTRVMLRMTVVASKGSASMSLVRVENSPLLDAPGSYRRRE